MDDLVGRVAAIIHAETNTIGNEAFNIARAIIPMVQAAEQDRIVALLNELHDEGESLTGLAMHNELSAAIRAIGAHLK